MERERLEDSKRMDLELPHLCFKRLPFDGHPCTLRSWHSSRGFTLPGNVALVPSRIVIEQQRRGQADFGDGFPRTRRKAPGKKRAAKRRRAPQVAAGVIVDGAVVAAHPAIPAAIEDGAVESGGDSHASDSAEDSEGAEAYFRDED